MFDPDGPLMTALGKFADIVLCNLMFCVFSLPVFTIGASLTALYSCMQELVYEEDRQDVPIFRSFWLAFRQNFRQATVLWLIFLLGALFLGAYYWTVQFLADGFAKIYQTTFYVLVLVYCLEYLYVFPLQARYVNSVKNTLKNAFLLGIAALPWTVLSLLVVIAAIYISFVMNPAMIDFFLYIWAACGFGIIAYLQTFFIRKAFQKISKEAVPVKTYRSDEAVFTDDDHREADFMIQESTYSNPNWNKREDILKTDKPAAKKKRWR